MAKVCKAKANKKSKGNSKNQLRKTVYSLLAAKKAKTSNTDSEVQDIQKYLVSFISDTLASAVLPTKTSTVTPTLTPPVSVDVAANQAALQLQGIIRRVRNKKWMTSAILSIKGILSDPDNTKALIPHLATYPVANDYVNARVCYMNSNKD